MKTIHIDSCPVCGNTKFESYLTCKDFLVSLESFSILSCSKCKFSFTQDFPSEDEIGKYYDAPEYISHSDSNKGIINALYQIARKITLRSKTSLIEKYTPDKNNNKLLDLGAGTGYFLAAMRKKKWIVTGIEKSDSTRKYAHEKFGLNIQNSEYLGHMPDKTKDIITMWHVLEHIEKLNQTFHHLHRVLKDDGTLFIALPNKSSIDAEYYKELWAAYDVPRHLWHFSPKDFEQLASKHGFRLDKIKRMTFDPLYISMLSEKHKGTSLSSVIGLLKGLVFLIKSFSSESKSSSIIYILKKK